MKPYVVRGQTANIGFVFIPDTTSTTGAGKTGLTNGSSGLKIAVRRELSSTVTAYSGANIGTITTLGTWADPTSGKVNFKEVDSTNMPGLYELHYENTIFSTSDSSRKLLGMVTVTGGAPTPFEIPLSAADLQDGVRLGLTALPNASAGASGGLYLLGAALTEAYRANGGTGSIEQLLYEILGNLAEASIAGTTKTVKKLDHSTTATTYTLNSATVPTSVTRAS